MSCRGVAAVVALIAAPVLARAESAGPFVARAERHEKELRERGARPEAIAPLAALLRLEDELPPGALGPALRAAAEGGRTHPLVAAQAGHQLALLDQEQGDERGADDRWRALGFWRDFWVLGPFDAQGRSGLGRVYPPEEKPLDPRRPDRFPGKEREIAWRRAPVAVMREGALFLDGMLRPDSDAVAYAVALVSSKRDRRAVLRLGTPGPVKVWINGAAVHERNVVRPAAPDQDAAAAHLKRGENWIVVKTLVTAGAWRVYLRFTDERGAPLDDLAAVETPRGPPPALTRGKPAANNATDLGALLRRRAEAAHTPEAWLDYARYLVFLQPEDVESKAAEAALRRAAEGSSPASIEALLLLGAAARDEDDRRAALEAVVSRAGEASDRALALTRLGELARQRRRDAAAIASWRLALEADPSCWPAALALAFDEQGAGLPAAALRRLDQLPADVRRTPRVTRARVRVLEALGRRKEAEGALRELSALRQTDLDVLQDLANGARSRGDLARAASFYQQAAALRPDLVFMTFEAARMLEGKGDVAAARKLLLEAAERLPEEPRVHEELGRLLARAGQLGDAVPALQHALALRPQNPGLRLYAERLASEAGQGGGRAAAAEDLAKRYAADAEALAKPAFAAKAAADGADGTVVLLDRRVVRVHRNGLSEVFAQRLVQVRTDRAARENQEFYVRYTPGAQEVEIRRARIFRQTAGNEVEVSEATGRDDRDLSEPWYGIYYDNRAEVVSYEDLRAGDVVEVQYTVADVGLRNEMADYYGDFQFIGETAPKRRWDYTLIGPAGRSFYFNEPNVKGLEKKIEKQGEEVVYRFSASDVPRVEPEPSMPGYAEVSPYFHVSTYRSWQDVGRWYWNLVDDQLTPDDTLRKAALQATANLKTDEEKIRALHRYVIEGTRYVGLEFGIHGYKPYKVTQVLQRRFGDCKDKASLLLALLREVGIDSELVLLRTRRGGRIGTEPASLAIFDHAIVYVPRLDRYLDGTAEFSGMAELPNQDQGVMVLRVSPTKVTLAETPVLPAAANRGARTWQVDVDAEGGARIAETLTLSGQAAPEWRSHYQTPGERQERFAKVWSGRYPGARVDKLEFEGIEDRNHPVTVRSEVQVPRIGEVRAGRELFLPVTARDADFVRSYARLSRRRYELQIAYPWQHEETLTFRIPEGWRVTRQPAARKDQSGFGRFELDVSLAEDGRSLRVRSLIQVDRNRITAEEYPAFRKFLGGIDGALGERIVLGKAGE